MPSEQVSQNGSTKELWERFRTDFEFFCRWCIKIRTKKGTIEPLILNSVQKRFLSVINRQIETNGQVRLVVLKARQQGLSTVISAWQLWHLIFHMAQKGLVMAHEADSTTAIFDLYRRAYDNLPDLVRPKTKYSSRTELVFDQLDCALRVATAGGRGAVARGETLTVCHLSEVGFWPTAFATQNFGGLIKAVPTLPGTAVFIESTANGLTGKFREMWVGACEGKNGFEPFFSAWFESPEYRLPAPDDFIRTTEENELVSLYGVDNEQLAWRRVEVARDGLDMFHQECPSYPEEAFIATGSPVFDPKQITALLAKSGNPISRHLVLKGSVQENSAGELLVFHDYPELGTDGTPTGERLLVSPSQQYVIGADVGIGLRGKDYSVAQILDSDKRQVAIWRGHCHPDHFAIILETLGYYYNTALINVERNNHGLLTCVKLGRDLAYPATYTEETAGTLDDHETINIGTYTTTRTKPMMVDKLRAALRKKEITVNDPTTLREMTTFIVTPNGTMEADKGCFDDCVMALALANHIHEGVWKPTAVTDEYYVEAI